MNLFRKKISFFWWAIKCFICPKRYHQYRWRRSSSVANWKKTGACLAGRLHLSNKLVNSSLKRHPKWSTINFKKVRTEGFGWCAFSSNAAYYNTVKFNFMIISQQLFISLIVLIQFFFKFLQDIPAALNIC